MAKKFKRLNQRQQALLAEYAIAKTRDELEELEIQAINEKKNTRIVSEKLTRGTKELIKHAMNETQSNDRIQLCEYVAGELEKRFRGKTLEYQLSRMDLNTTGKILSAIDTYIYNYHTDVLGDIEEIVNDY